MLFRSLLDLMSDTVVKDERLTAASLGEIRAYEAIINLCDDHIQTRLAEADAEQVE